ncbi:EthD family reductase [Mycobacteroides abscessus]|uniref:EthD family reductase n=1 Tax=Mycobacteroides abscessus TaxID=36809 RepID=A0ABD7HPF4_9MYCO|nr:EthD family reductase [Mycobacteroides abscessus]AWG62979.1 EthD family reductase [Mycobacteroides abscessus]PVA29578.1 EthD family reductase [Mycobacteroides abscessus]PVA43485.1 EthD family reductase [Mycobacteroides abscessus]PVA73562.1 EthD family reductase [Mycobacteroides abscessus]PVB12098.1 EthD family reductase [Mycobacteroides abscessus]
MHRVSICYGQPADPAAFDRYYHDIHAPLALKIPGLAGFTTGKCRSLSPAQAAPYYMVANLAFATAADLESALTSAEMAAAAADTANFADGGMTLYSTEEIVYA